MYLELNTFRHMIQKCMDCGEITKKTNEKELKMKQEEKTTKHPTSVTSASRKTRRINKYTGSFFLFSLTYKKKKKNEKKKKK